MLSLKRVFNPEEFTGWHMFGVMCLFFGTIISVNMFLAFSAGSTWTGLVVQNTYVESQHFNAKSAEYQRQAELGWHAETGYSDGVFSLALTDVAGDPVQQSEVTVGLGRPVHEGDDRSLQMQPSDAGGYTVETDLGPGVWEAELIVSQYGIVAWSRIIRFEVES
ncbi:MAG: FixH family protein [Alphaproteobacteria bacterium]|nr:FixH family protein [Alphaproteobacteria bacterium]